MKKIMFALMMFISAAEMNSQCVSSCSNYIVSPIQFSLSTTAGDSLNLSDDELSTPIPIGFTFNFMCSNYDSLVVSSNGFITFDLLSFDNGCCSGQMIPGMNTPDNFIAFSWNDLDPSGGGTITYTTIGVSPNQTFVLTYSNIPHCCQPMPVNSGQIKLFEGNNRIEIHSALITNDGSNSTQGIEDSTGTIGVATPGANSSMYTTTNTAYRWVNVIPTPPANVSGPSSVCSGLVYTFSVAPNPGASSYSWTLPNGWTGTSTTNIIQVTANAPGVMSVQTTYTCGTSQPVTYSVSITPTPTMAISGSSTTICPATPINLTASGADTYTWNGGPNTSTYAPSPTVSTSYTVSGTNSVTGCSSSAVTNVTVFPPTLVTTAGSGTMCPGQNKSLAANGASTYTWQPGNLSGFLITVSPTVNTTYTVTGTAANGCTASATASLDVMVCPGWNEHGAGEKALTVYPNPNSGEFSIELKNGMQKKIEIFDYTGKLVYSNTSSKDVIPVNISQLSKGIYMLKVESGKQSEIVRLVRD